MNDRFDANTSPLTRAQAAGHLRRHGHPLVGHYESIGGACFVLVYECCGN